MKKFLSLVLALIMTMSLVTIGASAAEYKDFTDKDEITYAEAVAVLNRLGIITGYSEGDFRPEGELTRGAAAKIIASLLIGPEAANNLSPTTAPFKDVPLDHTFAGPIAYCSTLKIINGYSDGNFQPGGTLTGYAFSKMLLGALGYDGEIEGFVGSGWNMNVMRLGGDAGLFDSISFQGNEPVNREQAAQLALNTLKATLVEYTGGLNVTAGDASVTSKPTRTYVISNQEYATHIRNRKASQQGNASVTTHYTVEFGEQHFVDLRMTYDRNTHDDFGRPSNEWSYKKVTIGTFPIEPDYVYTEQMEHDVETVTNATKARALGLVGFDVEDDDGHPTTVTVNGLTVDTKLADIGEIADYTDNGTVVEVYVDDQDADWIRDVVVVKTQLMEVKRIGSDYVALGLYDNGSDGKKATLPSKYLGFNQNPIDASVENVEVNDDCYTMLSGLKTGDIVAVVPVTTDGGSTYSVSKAYVPETASGALTKVETYANLSSTPHAIGVTVGDTAYDVALWNKDLAGIDGKKLDVTTKDVTLYLDEFGNALLAKNVGDTSDFMVVGGYYNSLVNGKLVTYVKGWDISGEELNLNLGSKYGQTETIRPGDLAYYSNLDATGDADWTLSDSANRGVVDVKTDTDTAITPNAPYSIKGSNTHIAIDPATVFTTVSKPSNNPWTDKGIKFIYVTFGDDGDVDFIEVKKGVQATNNDELKYHATPSNSNSAQAALKLKDGYVNNESTVKAVVIKNESNDAVATNMLYIITYKATANKIDGDVVYSYTVAMNTPNGIEEREIYSTKQLNRGQWARYTEMKNDTFDNFYRLKEVNQIKRATSTADFALETMLKANHSIIRVNDAKMPSRTTSITPEIISNKMNNLGLGDNDASRYLSVINAQWISVDTRETINDYDDLWDLVYGDNAKYKAENVRLSMIFNDDVTKTDGFRSVAMVVVKTLGAQTTGGSSGGGTGTGSGKGYTTSYTITDTGALIWSAEVVRPEWAAPDATVTYDVSVKVSGHEDDSDTNVATLTTGDRLNGGYAKDEEVEINVTNIEWSAAKLVVANSEVGATITTPADIKDGLLVDNGGTQSVVLSIPANKYTAGKVSVQQNGAVIGGGNEITLSGTQLTGGASITFTIAANAVAAGYPVEIVFTGMTAVVRNLQTDGPTVGAKVKQPTDVDIRKLQAEVAGGADPDVTANGWVKENYTPGVWTLPVITKADGTEMATSGGALYAGNRWDDILVVVFNGTNEGDALNLVITGTDAASGDDIYYVDTFAAGDNDDTDRHFFTFQAYSSNGAFGNTGTNTGTFNFCTTAPSSGTVLNYQIIGAESGIIMEGSYTVS